MKKKTAASVQMGTRKKQPQIVQIAKRLMTNRSSVLGLIIFVVLVLLSALAPVIAPYGPNEYDMTAMFSGPSLRHWFGTDNLGRDLFSRILYGGRWSLSLGICGALFSMMFGIIFGVIDGYVGGNFDSVFMRVIDIISSIPGVLLAILISTALGTGFVNTLLALSISSIPGMIRLMRAQVLREGKEEYLEAAKSINCGPVRIMFKHLLPNVISPAIVSTTMSVGGVIMSAASLSYLGLGIQPPTPEWGAMLSAGKAYFTTYPHMLLFPALFIAITVLSINLFGDGLRDAMDPKLKK